MKKKVLVTGAGGGGSTNLINSLRASSLNLIIYGTNIAGRFLAKSNADKNYILPVATEPNYLNRLVDLIERERIELVIPNNDREVGKISTARDQIPCRVFLPPAETVTTCQDKHLMYLKLIEAGLPVARSYPLETYDDIDAAFDALADTGDRFWIRMRKGSGSKGATWVKNVEQARAWISMWEDLRGFSVTDFTVSEFLPGRDYAFQSVWRDGKLMVAKMCERLSYYFGANRLSGMSSTPEVARTIKDTETLDIIFKTIHTLCEKPHGNFCCDLKGDKKGRMNITEFNIGRFCMITPIFDLTGKVNTAETYVRSAFNEDLNIKKPIDIEEDMYLLRELDTQPTIISGKQLAEFDKMSV